MGYDSFGNSAGSTRTRYTYTGRERDPDTGLLYYRARFYDPQAGRFISEDPIELRGGINLYTYVKNDPLRFVDPSGLTRCNRWLGALGGAMLGAGAGGVAGEAATTLGGAVVGLVAGPEGALIGGGLGAAAGVPVSVVSAGVGAGIGGYLGYKYCSEDDTCDQPAKPPDNVIPFPKPESRPTPLFPPLPNKPGELCSLKTKDGGFCVYKCKDGFEFKTFTDTGSKHGNCPPVAARP